MPSVETIATIFVKVFKLVSIPQRFILNLPIRPLNVSRKFRNFGLFAFVIAFETIN